MSNLQTPPAEQQPRPWGTAAGMLTASLVTIAALPLDLDPDDVLYRATVAGVIVGTTVCGVSSLIRHFLS